MHPRQIPPMIARMSDRISPTGVTGTSGGRPSREPTIELRPAEWRGTGGRPGIADQMIRSLPRLAGHLHRIEQAIASTVYTRAFRTPEGTYRGPQTQREQDYMTVTAPIWARVTADSYAGVTGELSRLLAWTFVARRVYGFALIERSWSSTPRGLQLECYPAHPSTVGEWLYSRDGRELLGVMLRNDVAWGGVPADRLHVLTWHPQDGPEGRSELRSLYLDWELLYEAKRGWTRRQGLSGGFIQSRVVDDSADEAANKELLIASMINFAVGDSAWIYTPRGYEVTVEHPGAADDGPLEFATYLDGEVDHVVGSWVAGINLQAAGSRALGEVLVEEDRQLWRDTLIEHGAAWSLVEAGVARDLGFVDIDPPVWVPSEVLA